MAGKQGERAIREISVEGKREVDSERAGSPAAPSMANAGSILEEIRETKALGLPFWPSL